MAGSVQTVTIEVPVFVPDAAFQEDYLKQYRQRHIDVQLKDGEALALKEVLEAARGEPLENGRLVQASPDVLRYLLRKITEQLGDAGLAIQ
jgi:hypothetical protein